MCPFCGFEYRPVRNQASPNDAALPRLSQKENVHAEDGHDHVSVKARIPDLGNRGVADRYEYQGHFQHAAPQGVGITQKSAWHLLHRLRKAFALGTFPFQGPVEANETYVGGKECNKHERKRLSSGRGTVGKTAVACLRDRKTGKLKAAVVPDTSAATLHGCVYESTEGGAEV